MMFRQYMHIYVYIHMYIFLISDLILICEMTKIFLKKSVSRRNKQSKEKKLSFIFKWICLDFSLTQEYILFIFCVYFVIFSYTRIFCL